jgi:hypothetical protein
LSTKLEKVNKSAATSRGGFSRETIHDKYLAIVSLHHPGQEIQTKPGPI